MFSDGMKRRRIALGITQSALSRISGVSQSTLSAVENGIRTPTEETMQLIAAGLGCSVSDLLSDIPNKKAQSATDDELRARAIARISQLSEPALLRVLDFLSGLQAYQEIQAVESADPDPDDQSPG